MRLGILAVVVSMVAACGFSGPSMNNGDANQQPPADAPVAPPSVAFAVDSSMTDHSAGNHTVRVALSAPAAGPVTVNYTVVAGGTAVAGTDFTLADGTVTFPAGEVNEGITAVILMPDIDETNPVSFTIQLQAPEGATLGQPAEHTVTISANPLPRINFATSSEGLNEDVLMPAIALSLDKASTIPIHVDYAVVTAQTTATGGGVDYTLANGTLTISAGQTDATIPLVIVDDTINEDPEQIVIQLSNPVNAELGPTALFTYTIQDNDAPPTVSFATATSAVLESAGASTVTVSLSGPSGKTITVPYTTALITASTDDVAIANGTLTFAPGDTAKTIPFMIKEDTLYEGDETFSITLGDPGATFATLGANITDTVTITDDDPMPTVSITTPSSMELESAGAQLVTVALSAVSGLDTQVTFTGTGTATEGADYTYTPATHVVDIPAGTMMATITVTILEDTLDEPNETAITTLSNPVNATLGATITNTITILDDDPTCIGPAGDPYQVCLTDMPAAPVTINSGLNTDNSPLCLAAQPMGWTPAQPAACFVVGTTITVTGSVKVAGSRPLVLVAATTLTINGTLDASSKFGGSAGPANNLGCGNYVTSPQAGGNGGGGGAGGSFMSAGGNGGTGNGGASAAGASLGTDPQVPTQLHGGCDGQRGGGGGNGNNAGTIGKGGGAIYLLSGDTIDLSAGIVDASGSGGTGGDDFTGGSGAGSGGMIEIYATTTLTTAAATRVFANGGGGAGGADGLSSGGAGSDPTSAVTTPAPGGTGGGGGNGGHGFALANSAQNGASGLPTTGGGGGGGGGGYISTNQTFGFGAFSAGVIDQ